MVFSNRISRKIRPLSQKETDKLIEELGGKEKFLAEFERHRKDFEFLNSHCKELKEKYPDYWVAVHYEKVVDVNKDFFTLLSELAKEGVPRNEAIIWFLDTNPKPLILSTQGVAA